ncbi:hypothetical protein NA78x_004847 [Anatilimnocola sp. NA78]|uniref:hypothetical protein n=1 Tax=Anatilimnocola sp. NA78 TaxID=3415683 RepID=UPI003CE4E461
MANHWYKPQIPRKGWQCVDVIDIRDGGDVAVDEASYATCEMCGKEQVRFVHCLKHDQYDGRLEVGCVCAEHLTNDYANPKARESKLRNKAIRKSKWLKRKWRISKKGNPYLNTDGHNLGIYPNKFRPGMWQFHVDGEFSKESFATMEAAKLALFEAFWEHLHD